MRAAPMHTVSVISDLTLAASAGVRASQRATIADLVLGGASDVVLANAATRTVDALRGAHATFGAARLDAVLGTLSQAALRATLARLDAGRPGISRMRKSELTSLLLYIAEGCNTWAEADAIMAAPLGGWGGFNFRNISALAPALPA